LVGVQKDFNGLKYEYQHRKGYESAKILYATRIANNGISSLFKKYLYTETTFHFSTLIYHLG